MAYSQDRGEVYLIPHQIGSLQGSFAREVCCEILQVAVSLFEIACVFTLSRLNILVKEENETSSWRIVRIKGKYI